LLAGALKSVPGSVFWDIGANYGAYALSLHEYAERTIAVEPCAETYGNLALSVRSNGASVLTEHAAAGAVCGECELFVADWFSGDNRIYAPDEPGGRRKEKTAMVTLDALAERLCGKIPPRNVLKVDVQGAECDVLRGAERLFEASETCVLFIEVWPEGLAGAGETVDGLLLLCRDYGFMPADNALSPRPWVEEKDLRRDERGDGLFDLLLVKGTK